MFPSLPVIVQAAIAVDDVVAIAVAAWFKEAVADATARRIPHLVMLSFVGRGGMGRREGEGTEPGKVQCIAVLKPSLTGTNRFMPW